METVGHISDTAYWIAAFRALETERPDAVFRDPLAKKFLDNRLNAIIESVPHHQLMKFAMVVRTVAIDRLILEAIEKGVDTVINLGAGLDTRPYRMPLPKTLNWVEIDFENIISFKNKVLAEDKPVCNLRRISCNLLDVKERDALFQQLGDASGKALVITEGVITYLSDEDAESLSRSLFGVAQFQYWIQDYRQGPRMNHRHSKELEKKLKNAPFRFTSDMPLDFFAKQGWKVQTDLHILDEADRIGRKFPIMFPWGILVRLFRKRIREKGNKTYGYVLFSK
jgi:methyltransferase (TIGR00027 family)